MGHWYLTPHGLEFDSYRANRIARHIGNVSLPENEPAAALCGDGWRLAPLSDPGASPEPWQVAERTVEVNAGGAKAVYVIRDRPLADCLAERRAKVNAIRDARLFPGVVTARLDSGKTVAADLRHERDMRNLNALYAQAARAEAGGTGAVFRFMDAANVLHDLTAPAMLKAAQAALDHLAAVRDASWRIKAALDAAAKTGGAALYAIDIDDGWPPLEAPPKPDAKP